MRRLMTMLVIGVAVMMADADTISNDAPTAQVTTNWGMAQAQRQPDGLFRYDTDMATNEQRSITRTLEDLKDLKEWRYLKTNALERNRIKANRIQSPIHSTTEPERKDGRNGGYKNLGIRLVALFALVLIPLWKCAMKANGGRFLLYICLIVLAIILFLLPFYLNTLADKYREEAGKYREEAEKKK